ncbi:MAG: SH3 domain-containing protein [SAR324 cluster bacterium]|uniref:SH3 domain-containing protein n=1 Tax=SAR324 cluster bacterium TaxID=2024889 RepID=A0A7X9FRT7_9DELT|nr:SH3 domain-containing protein [SAR324 cluster bacterium]
MLAETEVERLSVRYGNRTNSTAAPVQGDKGRLLYPSEGPSSVPVDIGRMPGGVTKDLPLATVLTESASLRTGPGAQYSTLMTVPKGQSLAVEGRQGEWLRIITPLGARAWVNSAAVQTGGLSQKAPLEKQQVPSGPKITNEQEDAAFHSLNSALQQNK